MILRNRGAKTPLLSVDLTPARVALNLRERGAVFPCKWCSVAEIYTITRISRSAAAILPSEASTSVPTEKSQLRDYCYAASVTDETNVTEQASELSDCVAALPDSPEILPETDAGSKPTSPSNVQELLNFLFGEESI